MVETSSRMASLAGCLCAGWLELSAHVADAQQDPRVVRPENAAAATSGDVALGACGEPATNIGSLQGTGANSPLSGAAVVVEGVVVASYQNSSLKGFFLQEEDADSDGDPNSSDGVFVYQGTPGLAVSVGEVVRVAGTVTEFDKLTELSSLRGLVVCPGAPPAVTPARLVLPVAATGDLEHFEGMLVRIAEPLTVTGNFGWGRYGSLDLSVHGRLFTPTQLVSPGAEATARQDLNDRSRIVLDDGSGSQNPNPIPYKDPSNTRRVGDTLASLTGVLDQRFGSYRLQPTAAPEFSATNPRPAPPAIGGRLHVASANVLNYFTTLDDGKPHCGPTGDQSCRGANTADELAGQRSKLMRALSALDADVLGLLEVENSPSAAISDLVAGLNTALGEGTYAFLDTGSIGSDAIKVGLLYKPARVAPIGEFKLLTSAVDAKFIDTKNRPVLAQTFSEQKSGARFTVAVNHWKSKGSDCNDLGDPDLGDGQGNCNVTRRHAAEAVIEWLASDPTDTGARNVLLLGDFNSYAKEDPVRTLEAAGYVSLAAKFLGDAAYSFQFSGQSGTLDYAFANANLANQVVAVVEWHNNADEPAVLDYNREFKTDRPFNADDPYRALDHDPLVIGLDLVPPRGLFSLRTAGPLWIGSLLGLLGVLSFAVGVAVVVKRRRSQWRRAIERAALRTQRTRTRSLLALSLPTRAPAHGHGSAEPPAN